MLSESSRQRLQKLAGIESNLNDAFRAWFGDSKVVTASGTPQRVHHGTGARFKKFNPKRATMGGIFWFTSNKGAIESGDIGAQGKGHIMDLYVSMQNPAGWPEYEKFGLGELKIRGYDGAILPHKDGFDGFVFDPNQLKSVENDGTWDVGDDNVYS